MIESDYSISDTNGVSFEVDYVEVKGHNHRIALAGNPEGTPVIVMMGVFEDSLMDSRWLVASMVNHPRGDEYRFIVVTVPFLEEYTTIQIDGNTMSKYDGMKPPNRIVPMKGTKPVDPRFDLENCAHTLKDILTEGLGIERAHFVGHDRGCIIMDNMLAEFPELAISYSRGSQGWTKFDEDWYNLTEKGIFLGPPHRIMATEAFPPLLGSAIRGGAPFGFIAPTFAIEGSMAPPGSEVSERWAAIQSMPRQTQKFFKLTRQMFRQTDFLDEGKRRTDRSRGFCILDTDFPMMQFQGSDEMIRAQDIPGARKMPILRKLRGLLGGGQVTGIFRIFRLRFPTYIFADLPDDHGIISNHTGDQPYWGKWNFWPDDVEDLLPGGEFQDRGDPKWKENHDRYVTTMADGRYSTLQTKEGGRFSRFVIVSDALHWTHIERPENVAWACMDFIADFS